METKKTFIQSWSETIAHERQMYEKSKILKKAQYKTPFFYVFFILYMSVCMKMSLLIADSELEEIKQQFPYYFAALIVIFALQIYRGRRDSVILMMQKETIEDQKKLIEEKQREIIDSITYAKRIQRALITSETYIDKNLKRLEKK
jgi:hypothetical protein